MGILKQSALIVVNIVGPHYWHHNQTKNKLGIILWRHTICQPTLYNIRVQETNHDISFKSCVFLHTQPTYICQASRALSKDSTLILSQLSIVTIQISVALTFRKTIPCQLFKCFMCSPWFLDLGSEFLLFGFMFSTTFIWYLIHD